MTYSRLLYASWMPDGRIQCDVCPRECKLQEGQRGLCFVRKREADQIVLTTYGRSSGFCIDPIEKKPLNHFYPGTSVLSFGTAGCNLTCKFCQNWDISKSKEMDSLQEEASPEQIVACAIKYGCESIAFTYNDPVIFLEYARDVARCAREVGVKTVAVTAGYIKDKARKDFFEFMDAANVDLKGFTDSFYQKVCGGKLSNVLETLLYLKNETKVWFEITTLLISDENDSIEEIDRMTQWIKENLGDSVPLHFTAFHPDYRMLDKAQTPLEVLVKARKIAIKNGLKYVYTGNVYDKKSSSTYCGSCQNLLIGREWFELSDWQLNDQGRCRHCLEPLAGVFRVKPGSWGAKRLPVSLR